MFVILVVGKKLQLSFILLSRDLKKDKVFNNEPQREEGFYLYFNTSHVLLFSFFFSVN